MAQKLTPEILIAAIAGFEAQKNHIDSQIAEIRQMLDGGSTGPAASTAATAKPRKKFSAATRRKMAAAQRARYAKLKQGSEPPTPKVAKRKRKMSAAGKAAIAAAVKRRWAAVRAAKKAAA